MKKALYIVLGIVLAIVGFFVWFFVFFFQVPELNIPENSNEKERIVLIDNWLEKLSAEKKFNGGVLFTKNGAAILAKTYGFTNSKKSERLDNNSSFRLASISKQFTAIGIMLLKERNQINYDDLISAYIKDFPYQKVTIRNLLNQTSGIPDVYIELAENEKDKIKILTNKKALDLLIRNRPEPNFEPNEKFEYSNTNYIILARIIELVSNRSFENFMKDNLFIPLGMNNTRVWNLSSEKTTFEGKTDGFKNIAGKAIEIKPNFVDGVAGDDGVFSSINDFIIWDNFWYKNDLISEENIKEAFKKPTLNNGEFSNYGFGWIIINEDIVMHKGAWLAAKTYYVRNTKKKTSFVLLDNSSNLLFHKIIENIKPIPKP